MTSLVTTDIMLGDFEFTVDGYVKYYEERNYGADADGNRGIHKIVVTGVENIMVFSDSMMNVYPKLSGAEKERCADTLTRKFLEDPR